MERENKTPTPRIKEVNVDRIQLENIYLAMENFTFSKNEAEKIVGGTKKLVDLIAAGKITAVKGKNSQKSKWQCNAAHVLRHCRDMRSGTSRWARILQKKNNAD